MKNRKRIISRNRKAKQTQMNQFTIRRICHLVGMANLFLTGSTNSMDLESSTSVRFVGTTATGADDHLRCTSRSGDTHTAWSVCAYQTRSTSRMSPQLTMHWHSIKNWWTRPKRRSSDPKSNRNSKTHKATSLTAEHTTTWKSKEFSDFYIEMRASSKLIPPSLC